MPNVVAIGQTVAEICRFFDFEGVLRVKIGVTGNFLQFYPSMNAVT